MSTTCDIYNTFGGTVSTSNVACELVPNFRAGRCETGAIDWTHYIDVAASVTIADGCSRFTSVNFLTYADGAEVRIPSGVANRYAVVWVEPSPSGGKRAYLMRHSVADWTQL